jgi:hypothetical protein
VGPHVLWEWALKSVVIVYADGNSHDSVFPSHSNAQIGRHQNHQGQQLVCVRIRARDSVVDVSRGVVLGEDLSALWVDPRIDCARLVKSAIRLDAFFDNSLVDAQPFEASRRNRKSLHIGSR